MRLFKDYELLSVDKSQAIKTMTSSEHIRCPKIYLDNKTSTNQTKTLVKMYLISLVKDYHSL